MTVAAAKRCLFGQLNSSEGNYLTLMLTTMQSEPTFTLDHLRTGDYRVCTRWLVEVLLYVRRNRRVIRDGSPGRPLRLSHSS